MDSQPTSETVRAYRIHREVVKLTILGAAAIAAFFVTRAIATSNRAMNLRDAAEWYDRGQRQLGQGDVDGAIESFRRAAVRNRDDQRYVFALTRALVGKGQDESARRELLALRESRPEDQEVNLQLARIAAARQDVTEAVRYYHNTLYAPWTPSQEDQRRAVRIELIDFLLTHDQTARALAELLAVAAELPEAPSAQKEVAKRFLIAGDARDALDHFTRALRAAPDDGEALAGAGEAAFKLGDYPLARGYLRRAPAHLDDVAATREIVELVLSDDPLASRIGAAERYSRLVRSFSHAVERFTDCVASRAGTGSATDTELTLTAEIKDFQAVVKSRTAREPDAIESGVDLVYRLERAASNACPPASALDQALMLIGERHAAESR